MEQQPQQLKPSQLLAYKRVVAENKRLKDEIARLKNENYVLRTFIGDKK